MRRRSTEKLRLAAHGIILRALRGCKNCIDGGRGARAIWLDAVERAGGAEAFQHAPVDGARIDAAAKIRKVGEGAFAACRDNALDCLAAYPAQRRQRVMDGIALDLKFDFRP